MTYSYDNTLSDDVSLVRFHIGDNRDEGHYLENEEIQYWVNESTTIGMAVVRCIQYIISQLSQPDFKLDWMSVTNQQARQGYETLLKQKAQQLGVTIGAAASVTISNPSRADSYQTDNTYDGAPA